MKRILKPSFYSFRSKWWRQKNKYIFNFCLHKETDHLKQKKLLNERKRIMTKSRNLIATCFAITALFIAANLTTIASADETTQTPNGNNRQQSQQRGNGQKHKGPDFDKLVEEGVITQEQVDAVEEFFSSQEKPERPSKEERLATLAEEFGMTTEELQEALKSGKKLEEIAEENGVDLEALREERKAEHEAQREAVLATAPADVQEALELIKTYRETQKAEHKATLITTLAATLNVSEAEVEAALENKTLKDLVEQQGLTREDIDAALKEAGIERPKKGNKGNKPGGRQNGQNGQDKPDRQNGQGRQGGFGQGQSS